MQFSIQKLKDFFAPQSDARGVGVIGIDVGSSAIKVVQLKLQEERAVLETYGELQLGPYADVEIGRSTNLPPAKLAEALTDILREAQVTSRKAGLSISYASSFVTVLSLNTTDEEQIAASVPIEARKYVPVPINEVSLDWSIIPERKGENRQEQESRILLAAIHNEALSKYEATMKEAGVDVQFTEIEIFSTIRSSVLEEDETIIIIDLGAGTTKLYAVSHGIVQLSHSIAIGSQDMTLSLSQALELSVAEAEELKRQVGLTEAGYDSRIRESLNFSLERILGESRRVISAYEHRAGREVQKVLFTGGGALLKGLLEFAHDQLERQTALADPFSKVEYPAFLEQTLRDAGPSFAVSMGVALRRLQEE